MKPRLSIIAILLSAILWIMPTGCGGSKTDHSDTDSLLLRLNDTIVVGTLYSPTSYFLYKGDLMGYHYDLANRFAKDKGVMVKFKVTRNMKSLLCMLDSGDIDIIAYNVPITTEFKERVKHCGPEIITHQVLVQPINDNAPLTDVTQLPGHTIVVEKGSRYEARMRNLDNELGGGIEIKTIQRDTLMAEDLIEMVAEGDIPMTVTDSDIAKLDHTYYDNIDISLEVSFPQKSTWAVRTDDKFLAQIIDEWAKQPEVIKEEQRLFNHYFEKRKSNKQQDFDFRNLRHGKICQYDDLFKTYSKTIGWDWRLLAAQAYTESNFNPNATSWAGARGLMQLMPATAAHYGLPIEDIDNPELNIKAAVKSISELNRILSKYVTNDDERLKFVLAAYNSGIAHIYDAIALAKKYGKNPQVWNGNVSEALLMKGYPEYYNDEVCKYGYFRGKQTVKYVDEVLRVFVVFSNH